MESVSPHEKGDAYRHMACTIQFQAQVPSEWMLSDTCRDALS